MDEFLKIATGALPSVLALAIRYGAPLVMDAIQTMNKDTFTEADLVVLESLVQDPEHYRKQ